MRAAPVSMRYGGQQKLLTVSPPPSRGSLQAGKQRKAGTSTTRIILIALGILAVAAAGLAVLRLRHLSRLNAETLGKFIGAGRTSLP
jgi:hypothetical protein